MDCSPPGTSVHGILQARILEWIAIPFPRGSSRPRDRTRVSCVSCIGKQILCHLSHQRSPDIECIVGNSWNMGETLDSSELPHLWGQIEVTSVVINAALVVACLCQSETPGPPALLRACYMLTPPHSQPWYFHHPLHLCHGLWDPAQSIGALLVSHQKETACLTTHLSCIWVKLLDRFQGSPRLTEIVNNTASRTRSANQEDKSQHPWWNPEASLPSSDDVPTLPGPSVASGKHLRLLSMC